MVAAHRPTPKVGSVDGKSTRSPSWSGSNSTTLPIAGHGFGRLPADVDVLVHHHAVDNTATELMTPGKATTIAVRTIERFSTEVWNG